MSSLDILFEWDTQKEAANLEIHGVSFVAAAKALLGECMLAPSANPGNDRERFVAIGLSEGREIAVIFTRRGRRIRIITARRARHAERRKYHENLKQKPEKEER